MNVYGMTDRFVRKAVEESVWEMKRTEKGPRIFLTGDIVLGVDDGPIKNERVTTVHLDRERAITPREVGCADRRATSE